MNQLKTLIRARKWQLDEQRRALAALHALADRLAEERRRLEEDLRAEQEVASSLEGNILDYGAFARQVIERRRRLEQSIAQVERQIAVATDQVAEAYQELKRYELAQEGRLRRQRELRLKRETAALDEVASSRYLRRQQEGAD